MRHRFKKYYDKRLTNVNLVIGVFKNRENNCITLVLPQKLFKEKYIYDISYDEYTRFRFKIAEIVEQYMKTHGVFHTDELAWGLDIDNIVKSNYNGTDIKWVDFKYPFYIWHHKKIHSSEAKTICMNIIHAYKRRHELRQSKAADKHTLTLYEEGGFNYNFYMRQNNPDRIEIVRNEVNRRLEVTDETINELTDYIKSKKAKLAKKYTGKDKGLIKYYLYLVNKKVNNEGN